MTVFHVAAISAALTFGLILASVLAARAEEAPPAAAQMNRHLYLPRAAEPEAHAGRETTGLHSAEILSGQLQPAIPVAQMNRHLYHKR